MPAEREAGTLSSVSEVSDVGTGSLSARRRRGGTDLLFTPPVRAPASWVVTGRPGGADLGIRERHAMEGRGP